jgi:hypothetical protein
MLKIITLGALGYLVYRHFNKASADPGGIALAGGPLSSRAVLQSTPEAPPV